MIVQRSWCLMCVNVMEMSDTISFSSKTWFYSPKCNKLKCAVDCCSQGNFCTVKVWWGSSCPLWVRMGSAGGGGMTCFTSVIAIAPCLRDYISNGHITSEFHFFSQAVGLCAACILRLLESFCWENSKPHFRHQTSLILVLRRMHAIRDGSVSMQLATEISNFCHEKISYK